MANPFHHALSSVKRYGGEVEDYLPIHLCQVELPDSLDACRELLDNGGGKVVVRYSGVFQTWCETGLGTSDLM